METEYRVSCMYHACNKTCDPTALNWTWIKVFLERGNVKSAHWFCCRDHALRMIVKVLHEI